jgi:hypothetical protein
MVSERSKDATAELRAFFAADSAKRAMRPLAEGFRVAVSVDGGPELLLTKRSGAVVLVEEPPGSVEFRLAIPRGAVATLAGHHASGVPELAVAIVDLLTHADPERKVRARVHAGLFELLRKGYFSLVPLGGAPLMRALAARGVGSVSELRERLKGLKEKR